jgi:hypothetical protein
MLFRIRRLHGMISVAVSAWNRRAFRIASINAILFVGERARQLSEWRFRDQWWL